MKDASERAPVSSAAEAARVPSAGGTVWAPDKLLPHSAVLVVSTLFGSRCKKNEMKQKKRSHKQQQKNPPCPLSHCSTPDKRRLFISSARGEIINSSISKRLSEGGRRGPRPLPPQGPLPPQRPLPPLQPELVDVLIPIHRMGAEFFIFFSRMVSKSR